MRLVLPAPPQRPLSRRIGGLSASVAAHMLLIWLADRPDPPAGYQIAPAPDRTVPLAVVPVDAPGEVPPVQESAAAPAPSDVEELELAGLAFDVAPIRARRERLFPFLTDDLEFLAAIDARMQPAQRPLINPFSQGHRADAARPPLTLADGRLQAVVDHAWSRQHRWRRFAEIGALVGAHDPDLGDLPVLLHAYLDQNILQPYYDGRGRDPRFWVMLGLCADHADFIEFVRSYTRRNPSSRATTELLFLIDELLQGSRDAMLMLLATEPVRDLTYTASTDREAYDLAVDIRRCYQRWLRDRQLASGDAVRSHYDQLRLRVLSTIVASTPAGYRAADAQYLAGEIFFRQGNLAEAVTWWRAITPNAADSYAEAYTELLTAMRNGGPGLAAQVIATLSGQHGRWLDASRTRLRHFGFSFDTF